MEFTEKDIGISRREFIKGGTLVLAGAALKRLFRITTKPESRTDWDNIQLTFQFVTHVTEKDATELRSMMIDSDIVFSEFFSYTEHQEEFANKISLGRVGVEDINYFWRHDRFTQAEMIALYNTRRIFRFIDIPEGHQLVDEFREAEHKYVGNYEQSFEERLDNLSKKYKTSARLHRLRENFMLAEIPRKLAEIKDEYPFLPKQLKIFLEFGSSHTRLLHIISQHTNNTEFNFPSKNHLWTHTEEVERRYWFAEDEIDPKPNVKLPDKNLLAHALMEIIIIESGFVWPNLEKFKNTSEMLKWLRSISNKFTTEEIESLWNWQRNNRVKNLFDKNSLSNEMIKKVGQLLIEKGVDKELIN